MDKVSPYKCPPVVFLKALRESDMFIEHIYSYGGCYQLYKILKTIYPSAFPYHLAMGHVATMIEGTLYDIFGIVRDGDNDFKPMTEQEMKEAESWSFAGNNDLYLGECPVCEQPITIDRDKLVKEWRNQQKSK